MGQTVEMIQHLQAQNRDLRRRLAAAQRELAEATEPAHILFRTMAACPTPTLRVLAGHVAMSAADAALMLARRVLGARPPPPQA